MTSQAEAEINRKLDLILGYGKLKPQQKQTDEEIIAEFRMKSRLKYLKKNLK